MLSEDITQVGRDSVRKIILTDPRVSGRHAQFRYINGRWSLQDLGSKNGTLVNGKKIQVPTPLNVGDLIAFGHQVCVSHRRRTPTERARQDVLIAAV
ncbi:MAG: FHA domain-containing protein [Deltaproteobacteria bacterium]|nr:FHA domain-containing protein [Deltaproteobacteria bacterium]